MFSPVGEHNKHDSLNHFWVLDEYSVNKTGAGNCILLKCVTRLCEDKCVGRVRIHLIQNYNYEEAVVGGNWRSVIGELCMEKSKINIGIVMKRNDIMEVTFAIDNVTCEEGLMLKINEMR